MTDLIRRLAARAGFLLFPPGRERPTYIEPRPTDSRPLPLPRSPYGVDTPLDVTAHRLARPYVTAAHVGEAA
ncbi:hypothetical protein AB0N17_15395 [Streptomyces sp. NPDC051133]|uniref:hypothetical protein n=1 Tax=Streptomyces sp. NPDC051133 TaxID=3155521 RepID=UPI00342F7662